MIKEDIVTKIHRMLEEGSQIIRDESLLRAEAIRLQHEKDKEYNKQYLLTTDTEFKMRIDRTVCLGSSDPIWWYLPSKELCGFMQECYARSFLSDIDWFHEIWNKWFDMKRSGMMTICISKIEKDGYFPVEHKYKENLYNDGSHMSWYLTHYVSNPRHVFHKYWVALSQGIREFIWHNMGFSPEKYSNDKTFTLWFKIDPIHPTKY